MKQKLKEYCDWLEDLTIAGDTINSKGLHKWITEYAKEYHTKQLTLTDVVKPLEVFEEIVFEDWLKQHRFTKDINHYIKNNITYREWEVFNMYTMDVYNL